MNLPGFSDQSNNKKRLFKCFCECTELTEEEIKRVYRLSALETLQNEQASKMLKSFLEQRKSGDESETLQFFNIYKLSENFKSIDKLTEENVEIIAELGLPFDKENQLKIAIKSDDNYRIQACLRQIQAECVNEIELNRDYKNFKEALLKKLES